MKMLIEVLTLLVGIMVLWVGYVILRAVKRRWGWWGVFRLLVLLNAISGAVQLAQQGGLR